MSNPKSILQSLFPASDGTRRNGVIAGLVRSTSTTSTYVPTPTIALTIRQLTSSPNSARGSRALETATQVLSLVSPATGAIPVAGPPLQAVVKGLLALLKSFDVSSITSANSLITHLRPPQYIRLNKEVIRRLRLRLHRLDLHISELPVSGPPFDYPRNILNE
jgi:hypothetical protein